MASKEPAVKPPIIAAWVVKPPQITQPPQQTRPPPSEKPPQVKPPIVIVPITKVEIVRKCSTCHNNEDNCECYVEFDEYDDS